MVPILIINLSNDIYSAACSIINKYSLRFCMRWHIQGLIRNPLSARLPVYSGKAVTGSNLLHTGDNFMLALDQRLSTVLNSHAEQIIAIGANKIDLS